MGLYSGLTSGRYENNLNNDSGMMPAYCYAAISMIDTWMGNLTEIDSIVSINPSVWSDVHCTSQSKHHLSWSDEHCTSCCTLSLIRIYVDNLRSKCNRAASCLFVKELALLWCGRQLLEIISSFVSLLSKFGFSFCSL